MTTQRDIHGSEAVTQGIRVQVTSRFVPEQSAPEEGKFFFSYTVTIRNQGDRAAKLTQRHWVITNAAGEVQEVRGPGVVGYTPRLEPGEHFQYTSFCPLDTPFGTMHGTYRMVRDGEQEQFDARIATFVLASPTAVN